MTDGVGKPRGSTSVSGRLMRRPAHPGAPEEEIARDQFERVVREQRAPTPIEVEPVMHTRQLSVSANPLEKSPTEPEEVLDMTGVKENEVAFKIVDFIRRSIGKELKTFFIDHCVYLVMTVSKDIRPKVKKVLENLQRQGQIKKFQSKDSLHGQRHDFRVELIN